VLADADSGAFQALVEQGSQLDRPVITEAFRDPACARHGASPWGFAIYGTVFCASPGAGYRPPAMMPGSLPRAYLVAGRQEPFFLKNATRWADALRDAGADVVMTERSGSHGDAFWREELPLMVAWAFGR